MDEISLMEFKDSNELSERNHDPKMDITFSSTIDIKIEDQLS